MTGIDLPDRLHAWVERVADAPVTAAAPHFAGASRDAWNVDVGEPDGGGSRALFLLCDKGASGGSRRDASVLAALAPTPVPVPAVVGHDPDLGAILLERVPGRSDFPAVDHESEREPTARHLMQLTGELHRLDPAELAIDHLPIPDSAEACARGQLAPVQQMVGLLGAHVDPLFSFAAGWLERNVPSEVDRISLVHSDMGPGNFLFAGGRVTAIVDWETAHYGDPMEDLAAVAVRDMATPMGDLPTRLHDYETHRGAPVDLGRIGYYRALVLTRNSLFISAGLADPPPTFDVVEMTMYQTLLLRAAALVLCDNLGIERPTIEAPDPHEPTSPGRSTLLAALRRDVDGTITPALGGGLATHRALGLRKALDAIDHDDRVGPALDDAELADLADLLGERPTDVTGGTEALRDHLTSIDGQADRAMERRVATYLARRMLRLAERRRPLLGDLYDRLPQPLEES